LHLVPVGVDGVTLMTDPRPRGPQSQLKIVFERAQIGRITRLPDGRSSEKAATGGTTRTPAALAAPEGRRGWKCRKGSRSR
jgi:hypothetical protein